MKGEGCVERCCVCVCVMCVVSGGVKGVLKDGVCVMCVVSGGVKAVLKDGVCVMCVVSDQPHVPVCQDTRLGHHRGHLALWSRALLHRGRLHFTQESGDPRYCFPS